MLNPPPMIEFLKLRTYFIRVIGHLALKWGMCIIIVTQNNVQYSGKTENKHWFQASSMRYVVKQEQVA